jgi:sugar transferase (PEP-CTERM system associated)
MTTNGQINRHWLHVSFHFLVDFLIFFLSFLVAILLRFEHHLSEVRTFWTYLPGMIAGALALSSSSYIFGLYSPLAHVNGMFKRSLMLLMCFGVAFLIMVGVGYFDFSSRIGRGVMLIAAAVALVGHYLHHGWIDRWISSSKENIAFLLASPEDEAELELFKSLEHKQLNFVGVVCRDPQQFLHRRDVLGRFEELGDIIYQHGISRFLVANHAIHEEETCRALRHLRYSGVSVVPLISLCEEVEQFVPLELVTSDWLLHASGSPHMLYIRKLKRGFDIAVSLLGLLVLWPILVLGMLAVRLTSPGPIFYRQVRCGRFGRNFPVVKLRTMRTDAEKDGAVWARAKDNRVTPVGGFLRKYRVDEIPQLFNVLKGDMTFVGPRPERPEFTESLAAEIPYFKERLLVQPGITGWAQVRFPYGSTVEDAKRKLEYDLYYMKHMSPFLDIFILLDTVRIIICGGLGEREKVSKPFSLAITKFAEARTTPRIILPPQEAAAVAVAQGSAS